MYGKSNMETYITIRKIDSQQELDTNGGLYQPRVLGWGGRWEGSSKWRRYMYTYG